MTLMATCRQHSKIEIVAQGGDLFMPSLDIPIGILGSAWHLTAETLELTTRVWSPSPRVESYAATQGSWDYDLWICMHASRLGYII